MPRKPSDITPAPLQHFPSHLVGSESPSPWQPRRYTCCYLQALTSQSHHCHYVSILTQTEKLGEVEEVLSDK